MIRLQFVCERAFSSQAIAWFSQGHFSHVDAVSPNGTLLGARADCVGGRAAGVWMRSKDYLPFIRKIDFYIPTTKTQHRKWSAFMKSQIGKPYDHTAIWGFVLGRDWREDDSWICSELQAAALEAAGIVPKLFVPANKITPNALAFALSFVPGVVIEDLTGK